MGSCFGIVSRVLVFVSSGGCHFLRIFRSFGSGPGLASSHSTVGLVAVLDCPGAVSIFTVVIPADFIDLTAGEFNSGALCELSGSASGVTGFAVYGSVFTDFRVFVDRGQ